MTETLGREVRMTGGRLLVAVCGFVMAIILTTGQAAAATVFADEFNGSSLASGWTKQNLDGFSLSRSSVSGGNFNLSVAKGADQWIGIDKAPRILRTPPSGTWSVTTHISSNNASQNGLHFTGLTVFKDASNWMLWGELGNSSLEGSGLINNTFTQQLAKMATEYSYLRIRHVGSDYFFDASSNGANWTNANVFHDTTGALATARVGILGKDWNGGFGTSYTVRYDYFRVTDQDDMPSALANSVTTTKVAKLTGADSINTTNNVNVCGTDLGEPFDWLGKTYIAFGDTNSCDTVPQKPNTMAYSTDTTLADGIRFDGWLTDTNGQAKTLFPPDAGAHTAIPTSAIGIGNRAYAYYMQVTNWSPWTCNLSSIATADSTNPGAWTKRNVATDVGAISWGPGNFNMVAALQSGTTVYVWGTPCGRDGSIKLMKVDQAQLLNKSAYQYFNGYSAGQPVWVTNNENAAVTVAGGPAGELSVRYDSWLGRYIMSYLDDTQDVIVLRESPQPWGPWSAPVTMARASQYPGLYGAFMKQGYDENGGQTIYYLMSQWEPYNVFWMKTTLQKN